MPVEINFIEKKENKYASSLFVVSMFILMMILVASIVFIQRQDLTTKIETNKEKLAQWETELLQLQADTADEQLLEKIEQEMSIVQQEAFPVYPLYRQNINQLTKKDRLLAYKITDQSEAILIGEFTTLSAVANYAEKLAEQQYIIDIELTEINKDSDSHFEAVVTVQLDSALVIEELNEYAQSTN
ncbi:hypothetical protein ACLIBH_06090 [Virgibacillus sp. W0430]|uniref:hypothetical protein n=1 Tax=Virgibacillus sp. W0430 TaxID=3391580 RepID=UPI003F44A5DA